LLWRNSPDTEKVVGLLLLDTNFNIIKKLSPILATGPRVRSGRKAGPNNFLSEDKLMNKLIAILIAGTFALGSVAAMADDKTPAAPVDQAKLKAERDAAKAAKAEEAKMTPEERKAARKAKRAARQKELDASAKSQQEGGASPKAQAEQAAKDTAASKAQPKALPTPADKQKALKETEKKAGAGQ
jgi:uncharacterized membrane protein